MGGRDDGTDSSSRQWVIKFHVGDVCHHWHSKRQGTVMKCEEGTHMKIQFDAMQKDPVEGWGGKDDGKVETRRKAAFIKGTNGM